VSVAAYLDEARRYGELMRAQVSPHTDWRADATDGAPLRIGFVSADLRVHPVGFFIENVVAHLDPQRVQLYAYVTRPHEDALSARIKPRFAAWRSIVDLDDESAARTIRDDGIHVLVDLSGHTDCNRLPVFAWKPAPVQTSWIAYFASTGLDAIDYVLGDRWVLPPDEADHFVERAWRLPHGYLCFTPPDATAEADAALHAERQASAPATERAPTFGYFGDLVKLNDRVLSVWARILRSVPEARLFVKAQQLGDEVQRERLSARLSALGIERSRLVMEGASPRAHYLAAYGRVDITLSPFPYPGGTTTAESLWMGVPVLCRRADRFLGHLCESVLQSVELGDWIASDDAQYVEKAVAFMRERASLSALAAGLRERMLGSSLCDAKRFARSLESAFAAMWQAHLQAR
jgi:protein O-GlcNAc transferase